MARGTFVFRLDRIAGAVVLRALEEKFPRSTPDEKKEIANVTRRLRAKLEQMGARTA